MQTLISNPLCAWQLVSVRGDPRRALSARVRIKYPLHHLYDTPPQEGFLNILSYTFGRMSLEYQSVNSQYGAE